MFVIHLILPLVESFLAHKNLARVFLLVLPNYHAPDRMPVRHRHRPDDVLRAVAEAGIRQRAVHHG